MLLALVVFRLIWGVVGSDTCLFRNFLTSPRTVVSRLFKDKTQQAHSHVGHSPLGGWMILCLLILLLVQTLSGLYIYNDVARVGVLFGKFPQTFVDAIICLHVVTAKALLFLITLHVLTVGFYLLVKRRNLVAPMVTGKQITSVSVPCPKLRSHLSAVWGALVAAGITYLLCRI